MTDLEVAAEPHSKSPSPIPVSSPALLESDFHSLSSPVSGDDGGDSEGVLGVEWAVPGVKFEECARCEWEGEKYQVGDVLYVSAR